MLGFALLVFVFFKNAWVCDDAYINFRSIEQLYSGNGPNWNPNQRVQVYTSPLWYWMLALTRLISPDLYFNAINLSFLLLLLLTYLVFRRLSLFAAGIVFFLFAASNAFVDYSSSGLENILASLLVASAFLFCDKALAQETESSKYGRLALVSLALLPVCRHDLVTIALPFAVMLVYKAKKTAEKVARILLMLSPLTLWSILSLVYYGAFFPNTAYAKLSTGIPRSKMIYQGLNYIAVTFSQDPITMVVIIAAIITGFLSKTGSGYAVSSSLLLNMAYIIWAGGDFMRGRFFSSGYVIAAVYLAQVIDRSNILFCNRRMCFGAVLIFVVYLVLFPYTPLNTGLSYTNFNLEHGIADERGYYFDVCSLYSYLYSKTGDVFPDFEWSHIGKQIAESRINYLESDFNGMLGYWAGTSTIIIDRMGLADPFLARLPVATSTEWRIGHFKREVPEAYRKSLETGKNEFQPGSWHDLYDLVKIVTMDKPLISWERFAAIVRLNLGLY